MRIGLNGGAPTVDRMVEQAVRTEADGFSSLWYPSAVAGDPLVAMALAGRATTTLELGTAVLQTYTSHPALMANRVLAVAERDGAQRASRSASARRTRSVIEGSFGISYANAGRHTEEYVTILTAAAPRRGGRVRRRRLRGPPRRSPRPPAGVTVPVLVAALAPPAAAGRGRGRRRHHPLDGQRAGGRRRTWRPLIRAAADDAGSRRAAHRGRAPGRGARQRRRGARSGGEAVRASTARCPTIAASSTTAAPRARPMPRSSATRPRSPRRSRRCSTPARPTCGRRSSPSATTATDRARAPVRCCKTSLVRERGVTDACCAPGRPHDPDVPAALAVDSTLSTPGTAPRPWCSLPGGPFRMGDDSVWAYPDDGEGPVHEVEVRPLLVDALHGDATPRFAEFVDATGHRTDAERYGWSFVFAGFLPDDFPDTRAVVDAPWWRQVYGADWRHPEGPHSDLDGRADHPVVHVSWNDARRVLRVDGHPPADRGRVGVRRARGPRAATRSRGATTSSPTASTA